MKLVHQRFKPFRIARSNHFIGGDTGIHIIPGGDNRTKIITHDNTIQLMDSIGIKKGIMRDFYIIGFPGGTTAGAKY